jgi:TIR domain-containing protein
MRWIRIFISHSTKTEQGEKFLTAVEKELNKKFLVDLDRKGLQVGDDWRQKIYEWMDEAHGAVLLLTPEALKSRFVQIETSILSWRSFRQPEFAFVPVLMGAVKPEDMKKGIFGELALSMVQAISLDDPAALAKKVSRALQNRLKEIGRPRTAFEVLKDLIVKQLIGGGNTKQDLREVGISKLNWGKNRFSASTDYYEKFAQDLLKAETLSAFAAIEQLSELGMKNAMDLLDLVAPGWVGQEEAKPVAYLAMKEDSKRAIGLNGKGRWAMTAYISRACFKSLKHNLPVCELTAPKTGDVLGDYKQQIIDCFTIKGAYAEESDRLEVKNQIEERSRKKPVFVVFPPNLLPDALLLEGLRKEFRTVTFFILTGDEPLAKLHAIREKVDLLTPLDRAREASTRVQYSELSQSFNKLG